MYIVDHQNVKSFLSELNKDDLRRVFSVVTTAADIIEGGWCTGSLAIAKNGRSVPVKSKKAERFCAAGGIARATLKFAKSRRLRLEKLGRELLSSTQVLAPSNAMDIVDFNDEVAKDKRDVVRKFDKAASYVHRELVKRSK